MERIGFTNDAETQNDYNIAKEKVMAALKEHFRPEFLNRLDDIVLFDILTLGAVREIVNIQIGLVKERLQTKEITMELSQAVYEFLAKEGYNPQYGARPLKRIIQNRIMTPIANLMVSKRVMKGGVINVDVKESELIFDVKRGRKGSLIDEAIAEELISV